MFLRIFVDRWIMLHVTRGLWSCTCILTFLLISDVIGTLCQLCDCLAGIPGDTDGGISHVQVRCQEGTVTWYNTHGAVRMTLNPLKQGMFRYCLRIDSDVTTALSREMSIHIPTNYRTKVEGYTETELSPLFTSEGQGKEHCISGSGPIHLYLQSDPSQRSEAKVKVHYDIERLPESLVIQDSMEECRPCTDRELLRSVCSSDFVAVGRIDDVTHDNSKSNIRVSVSHIISQKGEIFTSADDNSVTQELTGVVHAPLKCGIRHGEGQFMFTGRVRLGQPVLQCAPRYQQWKRVLEKARTDGQMECILDA